MKGKRIFGFLQSLVLGVLFLLLIAQCAFYISLAENIGGTGLEPFPDSEISLLSGSSASDGTASLISPFFIGVLDDTYSGSGTSLAVSGESEGNSGREIWQMFVNILENAGKGTAKQVNFSDGAEKNAYLSRLYNECGECYYASFADGIEFSVLTSLLTGVYDVIPENPDFVISDMFLVCGSSGEASIIATDLDGGVLKIFPSKNITFNNEIIKAYNNSEKDRFVFKNIQEPQGENTNGYFPVLLRSFSTKGLVRSEFGSFFNIAEGTQDSERLVSMLGMNIDNTRTYITSDGDIVFVEDTVRLRVSDTGELEYTPDKDGTPVSRLFDTDADGFGAAAETAQHIALSLSEALTLADASLRLTDVQLEDSVCRFIYGYCANGIPIVDYDYPGEAVVLEFSADRLIGARMNIVPYRFSGAVSTDMPQKSALAVLAADAFDDADGDITYFGAQYVIPEGENTANIDFALRLEREANE